ncbi:hypothetical protein [Mycolicibacterium sp.]|uniref:hypothetical protein n=1 Tax=Mycolicibacterium sp. TaxID=2320850 RepID=UPI0025EE13B7|nr:hypothetical protein [Mycolicibacterium sp.]
MDNNGPFGIDPEEFDRVVREAGEGLRDAFGKMLNSSGQGAGFGMLFDQFIKPGQRTARPRPQPETAGEAGDGVWAIYISDGKGKAHVEQVYKTELDALRANKHNTDNSRNVRFLPYGIDVSVLDASLAEPEEPDTEVPSTD